jgi:PAS domain S-box-containing protein
MGIELGVMGASPVIERAAGHEQSRQRRGQWLLLAGFLVLAAVVVGLAYWAWAQQAESITDQAKRSLDAVAELKAGQIAAWTAERHGDAEVLRDDKLLSAAVSDLLAGHDAAASAARIRSYLHVIQQSYGYVDVVLVAPDGRTLVRTPATARHPLGPRVYALIAEAERTREVVSSDLYLGPEGTARIELIAPILASRRADPPVASVVLHVDPQRFLYPFIQDWPLPSDTGETLLVERHGDRVVYLNELRHRKGTALKLSVSARDTKLPAAMAVRGRRGIIEGIDYRGIPVMAAIAPVPTTDWYVVAKVDQSEVLDPIRKRGWLTAGFTLLVVALGAVGALLLWRLRERQVLAELRASELKYRTLVENLSAGVVVHAADTRIVLSNPAASRLLGLSGDQLEGRTATDPAWHFLDQDGSPMALEDYPVNRVVASGEPFDGLIMGVVRTTGAEPLWLLCSAYPAVDGAGDLEQVVVTFIDITAMVRAEQDLRASERKFRETVESLDEGYYSVAVDGTILDHNPAFCRVLGLDQAADIRGQRTPDFWQRSEDREPYLRLLREEGHVSGYLARAKRADGSGIVVLLNAHFVRDDAGEVEFIEGTVQDFTARKAAEDEVERLNAELEQRVADRTAELDGANKELEAFAYSVSHDLRAPLRHISGFSALLAERTAGRLDEKSRHYVEVIATSVRQMGVLIDDLLQFSRTGRAELVIGLVDMRATLEEVLEPLKRETDGRDVDWSIGELPSVVADRALVRQVWANLVGNAVKYTRGRTPATIEIGAAGADGQLVFYVRDNGVGFDMQYAHKLFGVFQRLHSDAEFEGTGIGLANVRRIVTRLGGAVWAESDLDNGATFFFSLPDRKEPTS